MECYDEGDEDPSICMHKKGYLGFGSNLVQMPAWFDLRVFYVRVCSCPVDDGSSAPQYLTLRHIPKNADIALEVNGGRIVPSEGVSLVLRRDRVDKESEEATFVSTDNVRTTGTLQFEVYDQDDLLLCGTLELLEGSNNDQGLEKVNPLSKNQRKGWSMDCCSAVGPAGCGLLRGRNIPGAAISPPTVEVYVAGCFSGFPVILTKTVQLICRRKISRWTTMDAIPENKTIDRNQNSIVQTDELSQDRDYEELDEMDGHNLNNFYPRGGYIEGDDGELSWFNAGVRVGVGIGLGMCLGIGIGVGLFVRTYQATTRSFRKRLF